jgi:hypothetical protein
VETVPREIDGLEQVAIGAANRAQGEGWRTIAAVEALFQFDRVGAQCEPRRAGS